MKKQLDTVAVKDVVELKKLKASAGLSPLNLCGVLVVDGERRIVARVHGDARAKFEVFLPDGRCYDDPHTSRIRSRLCRNMLDVFTFGAEASRDIR